METKERCDMAIEVLRATNDGDQLAPQHLYLVQEWVNDSLNEAEKTIYRCICSDSYRHLRKAVVT